MINKNKLFDILGESIDSENISTPLESNYNINFIKINKTQTNKGV